MEKITCVKRWEFCNCCTVTVIAVIINLRALPLLCFYSIRPEKNTLILLVHYTTPPPPPSPAPCVCMRVCVYCVPVFFLSENRNYGWLEHRNLHLSCVLSYRIAIIVGHHHQLSIRHTHQYTVKSQQIMMVKYAMHIFSADQRCQTLCFRGHIQPD